MSKISVRKRKKHLRRLIVIELVVLVLSALLLFYLLQRYWAHRKEYFVPDYSRVTLTENSDYETIFLQTGLGKDAVDRLIEEGDFPAILEAQELFFCPLEVECTPLLGWFTREDRLANENSAITRAHEKGQTTNLKREFVDLQPGDILVSMSTHTGGWNHGHAGLVIDEDTTLECRMLGTDSGYGSVDSWLSYSNVTVLRVKGATAEQRQAVVEYAEVTLVGVPYHLTAGFIGDKAPDEEAWHFGLHCAYLEWYAWNEFGYDLDANGGRLVTAGDLLRSDLVEVVQVYGLDPREFLEE